MMLICNANIVTMSPQGIVKGDILIEGNNIIEVGSHLPRIGETIDANGMVALPGFVNTHCHSAMTLFRGMGDDMPVMEWLEKKIWPLEAKLTSEDIKAGARLACLEMVKAGITTFADMYFKMDIVGEVCRESGIRGHLGPVLLDLAPPELAGFPTLEELGFTEKTDYVVPTLMVHAPYSCKKENLINAKKLADEKGVQLHIHVSESKQEVRDSIKKYGLTPVEYLDAIGFLGSNVLIAHAVHLTGKDIEILKNKQVKISHCSASNMKTASGTIELEKLYNAGLIIGLGTDGAASNNRLDMIQEMKIAALLQKVHGDPIFPKAKHVLEMGTLGGARTLGMEKEIGSIEKGKRADIILMNFSKPHLTPLNNIYSHTVYSAMASDVDTVIANGRILMRRRELLHLDEKKIMEDAETKIESLVKRAGE